MLSEEDQHRLAKMKEFFLFETCLTIAKSDYRFYSYLAVHSFVYL